MQVSRLASKASQLITNETTNLAESWMHVRSKYVGGMYLIILEVACGSNDDRSTTTTQLGKYDPGCIIFCIDS